MPSQCPEWFTETSHTHGGWLGSFRDIRSPLVTDSFSEYFLPSLSRRMLGEVIQPHPTCFFPSAYQSLGEAMDLYTVKIFSKSYLYRIANMWKALLAYIFPSFYNLGIFQKFFFKIGILIEIKVTPFIESIVPSLGLWKLKIFVIFFHMDKSWI